jgi:hypothetical protein
MRNDLDPVLVKRVEVFVWPATPMMGEVETEEAKIAT